MKLGVLGTGTVGRTIATALVAKGYDVRLGSRTADHAGAREWVERSGGNASQGTFAAAADHGAIVFNCTKGSHSLDALGPCRDALHGKVLVDVTNAIDPNSGFPPSLFVCNTESLAERIQQALPETRVVKALNTLTAALMVDGTRLPDTDVFIAGNDPEAKASVSGLLHKAFGWPRQHVIDVGDLTASRGLEMFLPLWLRLYGAMGTAIFNVRVVRG
jgi:predicted dinucleotide-binding enzyme